MGDQGFTFLDPPSREDEILRVLTALAAGDCDPETLEANAIDLKEEAGRRDRSGILPGHPHSETVARQLAEEAACMANTRGGGALVVGVDDKTGELIGAETDADWLRTRIYELTESKVTADIRTAAIRGVRLLVLSIAQAVEPVPFRGRYQHRRGKSCVPVTSTELLQGLFADAAADPSHRRSGYAVGDISDGATASLGWPTLTAARPRWSCETCSPVWGCSTGTPTRSTWPGRCCSSFATCRASTTCAGRCPAGDPPLASISPACACWKSWILWRRRPRATTRCRRSPTA